jgi:phage virion morphogenesis protein
MSTDGEGLEQLEAFLQSVMQGLSPAEMRKASMKIGQAVRRANLQRIAMNVQPDGTPMAPRRPRMDTRGRLRRADGGKMFRKLRAIKGWQLDARADGVELRPGKGAKVVAEHHFGLRGYVGRSPTGERVFTRYAARPLLGFAPKDEEAVIEALSKLIDPQKP